MTARAHLCSPRRRRSRESGYAYLLALFMVLMVIVGSSVVLENAVTQGRRAREEEMMWRGQQYIRAIKRYYRKTGHYPQNLDDLEKGIGNVHFLRGPYPDPMNKNEEGKWRFIYTNATGQIIGSTRYATMQQMAILDLNGGIIPGTQNGDQSASSGETPVPQPDQGNCTTPVGGTTGDSSSTSGFNAANGSNLNSSNTSQLSSQLNNGQLGGNQAGVQPNANQQSSNSQAGCQQNQQNGAMQGQPGGSGIGSNISGGLFGGSMQSNQFNPGQLNGAPGGPFGLTPQSLQALAQLKPTGPVDSPVIGGFLVGVGSTVDAKSVRVYKHAKNYKDWEFIWNPLEEQALAIQQGINQAGVGLGLGGLPGGQMNGSGFGNPQQPGPTGTTSPGSTSGPPQTPSGPQ